MIRSVLLEDCAPLLSLIAEIGLFPPGELSEIASVLDESLNDSSATNSEWLVDEDDRLVSAAYYAAERFTEGTWNLLMIAVHPDHRRNGRARTMIAHIANRLREQEARLLLVETSGLAAFEGARALYLRCGFREEGRIRDYYRAGEDKVIYRLDLTR